jgi:hypothetical protein
LLWGFSSSLGWSGSHGSLSARSVNTHSSKSLGPLVRILFWMEFMKGAYSRHMVGTDPWALRAFSHCFHWSHVRPSFPHLSHCVEVPIVTRLWLSWSYKKGLVSLDRVSSCLCSTTPTGMSFTKICLSLLMSLLLWIVTPSMLFVSFQMETPICSLYG